MELESMDASLVLRPFKFENWWWTRLNYRNHVLRIKLTHTTSDLHGDFLKNPVEGSGYGIECIG